MLREDDVRVGFFEREQYEAVLAHLPEPMRPVVTFAYVTGWRINSEVLSLQWRQVDLRVGEVRLDPKTTEESRREGVLPDPGTVLQALNQQRSYAEDIQRQKKMIVQHVFFHRSVTKAGIPGYGHPQHGPRRHPRTRGDEIERPQDSQRLHRYNVVSDGGGFEPAWTHFWAQYDVGDRFSQAKPAKSLAVSSR